MNDARISKAARIIGHRLVLRNATDGDAEFIYKLRTDAVRNKYVSPISPRLDDQIDWLRKYKRDPSQAYFIVERSDGVGIGTVRMYEACQDSFCWGSWIFIKNEPFYHAIESALIIYSYGLLSGFGAARFEVDKANASVCRFHEAFGACRVGEEGQKILYSIGENGIKSGLFRYRRFLPSGITVMP